MDNKLEELKKNVADANDAFNRLSEKYQEALATVCADIEKAELELRVYILNNL